MTGTPSVKGRTIMATPLCTGNRPVPPRPPEPAQDLADNLTLMLTARRRRHLRRSAWTTR